MRVREPLPGRVGFRHHPFLALLAAGCACLVAAVSGCSGMRGDCPACKVQDSLAAGCPFDTTQFTGSIPSMLLLSGGASYGAWGAGVLVGWPAPRPEFSVVTGISVGALQATWAFLGGKESDRPTYDPLLEKFFTTTKNTDVYTWKWYFALSNSLQSRAPLKNLIDTNLKDEVIDKVADASSTGNPRELWVGTVNLDTSQFCRWNLSEVAKKAKAAGSTPKAKCYHDLYRDVVWAASGAPVIAPPVPIDAAACEDGTAPHPALHVDGGARLRVFAQDVLQPAILADKNAPVYVIVNGKVVTHPQCVMDSIMPIAARAFEIMDHESLFGSLYYLAYKLGKPGIDWNLQLSRIDDKHCLMFQSSDFNPVEMQKLFEAGKASWVSPSIPWTTDLPQSTVAEWPPNCWSLTQGCPFK